jgi:hypothetical protein
MKMLNHEGKEVDAFLEIVKERVGHVVTMSEIQEPTEKEVALILSKPCSHPSQLVCLVYDEHGAICDLRNCVVCGHSLGTV